MSIIDFDEHFKLDLERLNQVIYKTEVHFPIIVCNVGSTAYGSVDDIEAVSRMLPTKAMIHLDAAFGGMVLPFIDGIDTHWFDIPNVFTMGLDLHKMA